MSMTGTAVSNAIVLTAALMAVLAGGAFTASFFSVDLQRRIGNRLPASSRRAFPQARRQTFGSIDTRTLPSRGRALVRRSVATALEAALDLGMAGLRVLRGLGGPAVQGRGASARERRDDAVRPQPVYGDDVPTTQIGVRQ
jgi:hypothetical protein